MNFMRTHVYSFKEKDVDEEVVLHLVSKTILQFNENVYEVQQGNMILSLNSV